MIPMEIYLKIEVSTASALDFSMFNSFFKAFRFLSICSNSLFICKFKNKKCSAQYYNKRPMPINLFFPKKLKNQSLSSTIKSMFAMALDLYSKYPC